MYRRIKAMFNRQQGIAKNLKHYVEVYLQYGPFVEKKEIEIETRDPFLTIELFKSMFEDCDRIIKFRFFDRIEIETNDLVEERKINCSGNYYFGTIIRFNQLGVFDSQRDKNVLDSFSQFDEYQVGGVIHFHSSLVMPLYANDIVIGEELCSEQQKIKIKKLYKQHGI